ncbi:hypothetical protein GCM10010517_53330 [Streptosporangium fragile]|uniref:Uncharacterized protein n=1 Tax=Streptosporangium fragile TaxID=46186 RepID=A0ABP6IMI1_9ACTN
MRTLATAVVVILGLLSTVWVWFSSVFVSGVCGDAEVCQNVTSMLIVVGPPADLALIALAVYAIWTGATARAVVFGLGATGLCAVASALLESVVP